VFKLNVFKNREDKERDKYKKELEKFNKKQEELDNKYKKQKQKYDFKSLLSKLKFETYMKRLVAIVTFVSLIDLQLSYILAFMGKDQIAESLSIRVCEVILGTVFVYALKAYFETKAEKHNELIKDGYITPKDSTINDKIREVIDSSGLSEHIDESEVILPETEDPSDCS
jgi:uncharacterized membrane protein (DUF485 family)